MISNKSTHSKKLAVLLSIFIVIISLIGNEPLRAGEKSERQINVNITTGFRILPSFMWGFIPMPPSAAVAVDINRLRIRTDLSYHPYANSVHSTLAMGFLFLPKGKTAPKIGGLQIKLPILLDVGFVSGQVEAGDGYVDEIIWLLLGPSAGADFTWWKPNKFGFIISLKVGFQIKHGIYESYSDGYSYLAGSTGMADCSILFGIAI